MTFEAVGLADTREQTIGQIADAALGAWQTQASPSIEMAIAPIDRAGGGVSGVVWISIGTWSATLSAHGARRLAREISSSWDWAQALLPYDPANLGGHLLAMAARAERLNETPA